ncbi:MAG: ECF transporter S component [Clostridiales Family XIII bacterium]|jgi:uncharacterized membrane protein|nr:ECF transporter S component [Clostridiales Family XIII bacterium]
MKINSKVAKTTITALFAALTFVVTFIVRIPIPFASGGYLNIGDSVIYIAAGILGGPLGALSAGIGSALSDLLAGYTLYAPATFIIKALMGLAAGFIAKNGKYQTFVIASIVGGAIMVAGYFTFEIFFIYGLNLKLALTAAGFNAIQWAGGVIVAAALYPAIKLALQKAYPASNQIKQSA